ncbi:hypothetical protein EIL50_02765 [bacterium NHP-B]|nr:hypothetical protein EIL50_02765 [bacterium NHP-B]
MALFVSFLLIVVWTSSFLSAMDPDDSPSPHKALPKSPPFTPTPAQQDVMAYIKKNMNTGDVSATDARTQRNRHLHTTIDELYPLSFTVTYKKEGKVGILSSCRSCDTYALLRGHFDDGFLQIEAVPEAGIRTLPEAIEHLITWRGSPDSSSTRWRCDIKIHIGEDTLSPSNLTLSSPLVMNLGIREIDLYKGFPTFGEMPHLETVTFLSWRSNVMWLPLSLAPAHDHLPHLRAISCFGGDDYLPKPYLWAPKGLVCEDRVMMEPPLFQYSHLPDQVGWADYVPRPGKLWGGDCVYVPHEKQPNPDAPVASPVAKKFSMFTLDRHTAARLSEEYKMPTTFEAYRLTVTQRSEQKPTKDKEKQSQEESKEAANSQDAILALLKNDLIDPTKKVLTDSMYNYLLEQLGITADIIKKGDPTAQQNVKDYFEAPAKYHSHTAEDRFMHKVLSAYLPLEMWWNIFGFLEQEPLMVWRLAKRYPAFAPYCQNILRAAEPCLPRVILKDIYEEQQRDFCDDGGSLPSDDVPTFSDDDDEDSITFNSVPPEHAFSTIIDGFHHVSWLALHGNLQVKSTIAVTESFSAPSEASKEAQEKAQFYALTVRWEPDGKAPWGAFTAGPFYVKQPHASKDQEAPSSTFVYGEPIRLHTVEEDDAKAFLIHTLNILACEELNAYKEAITHPEQKS